MAHPEARFIRGPVPFPSAPTVTVVSPVTTSYAKVTPSTNTLKTLLRPRVITQSLVWAATIVHKIADANGIAATNPAITDANAYALVNEIKADFNTHIAATAYHVAAGTNTIATADADDTPKTVALTNAIATALAAHMADTAVHGGMTDAVNLALVVAAATTCTDMTTAKTEMNLLATAWLAHLAVTDLGAYMTAGPVGLPIDWPCSAPFYAKTDTSAGVFTVAEWTGW